MSQESSGGKSNFKSSEELKEDLKILIQPPKDSKVNIIKAKEEEAKELDYKAAIDREHLARIQDDNKARRKLRTPLFILTLFWILVVLSFVMACGVGWMHLSDTVLVTLLTTTSVNILGFFYIVVNYLFNKERST